MGSIPARDVLSKAECIRKISNIISAFLFFQVENGMEYHFFRNNILKKQPENRLILPKKNIQSVDTDISIGALLIIPSAFMELSEM